MHTKGVPEPGAAGTRNQKLICTELSSPRQHAQRCTVHCTITAGYFFCFCSWETSLVFISGTGRDVERIKKREGSKQLPSSSWHLLPPFPSTWYPRRTASANAAEQARRQPGCSRPPILHRCGLVSGFSTYKVHFLVPSSDSL